MTHTRNLLPLALAVVIAFLPGCGGTNGGTAPMPDYGSEEGLKIAQMVSNFNEDKADAVKFKKSFAEAPTADWRKYDKYNFEVKRGSLKVDGNAATATIAVRLDANNEDVTTKEWAFVKVGNDWKLKTAPLP